MKYALSRFTNGLYFMNFKDLRVIYSKHYPFQNTKFGRPFKFWYRAFLSKSHRELILVA